MGAAAGIYLQHSGFVHESRFAGWCSRLCLGLTAPWTHLSGHRLARRARPPATLASPVIHTVPIVSGQHRWWCPGDCHLWNTRGGWTFFCRVSYGSNFLVFPRHGHQLVVSIPANLWDVKSISAFILPQVSARHECQYMDVLSHPTRPHTPDPLTHKPSLCSLAPFLLQIWGALSDLLYLTPALTTLSR